MDVVERFFTSRQGKTWLFRTPVAIKYLLITALLVLLVLEKSWAPQLFFLSISLLLYLTNGLARELGTNLLLMIIPGVLVSLYHWYQGDILVGVGLVGVFFSSLSIGRILFLTTELPVLMSAVAVFLRPLKWVGLQPTTIALAMYLMIRTIPWLFTAAADIVAAHRARGLQLSVGSVVTPTVIAAVGYAKDTADALTARDLV